MSDKTASPPKKRRISVADTPPEQSNETSDGNQNPVDVDKNSNEIDTATVSNDPRSESDSTLPLEKRRISVADTQSDQSNEAPNDDQTLNVDKNSDTIDTTTKSNDPVPESISTSNDPGSSPDVTKIKSKEATKITDLNEKCLKHIFSQLEFSDLLNVANSTKQLREAAGEIYTARYGDRLVRYNGDAMTRKGLETDVTDAAIIINDGRSCLKMLRGFGALFTRLKLNFNRIGQKRSQAIAQTLNEYCPKTLIELEWHYCPVKSMNHAIGKFIKLTSLRIVSGFVGLKMGQFTHLFPQLQRLELVDVEVAERKCVERTFHGLRHLKLSIESRKGTDFLKSNVKAALDLNPQLTSFSIIYGCDLKLLSYINDKLPLLETLEIQNARNKFYSSAEPIVVFNRVKNLTLDLVDSKDSFTNIPFAFRCLRKFTLNACARYRDEWVDFAVQNQRLVELKLLNFHWFYVMKPEQLMKIAGMPRLSTLILDWRVDSSKSVTQFMDACQSLHELRLSMRTRPERAAICAEVGKEWQTDIDEHFLSFKRNIDLIIE